MTPIRYITGDATQPIGGGVKIIAHCCNNVGAWGAGFVLAISRRWPEPEAHYRRLKPGQLALGEIEFVSVAADIFVANIIGQDGVGYRDGVPPIRYEAIRKGLNTVLDGALICGASVHMPRIGCGLAGGTWEGIEPIIQSTLCAANVSVFVYDLPTGGGAS